MLGEAAIATIGVSFGVLNTPVFSSISGIRLGLHWKLRPLDTPFGFLVLEPSGVRFTEVSFRNYLVERVVYRARSGIRI